MHPRIHTDQKLVRLGTGLTIHKIAGNAKAEADPSLEERYLPRIHQQIGVPPISEICSIPPKYYG